jgi:hypothetical protein
MQLIPPLCAVCTHYDRSSAGFQCAAFPKGIPAAILESTADHRLAFDGDGGTRFEPNPDMPADLVEQITREVAQAAGSESRLTQLGRYLGATLEGT